MSKIKEIFGYSEIVTVQAADGNVNVPSDIEILHTGNWSGPNHPNFSISAADIEEYVTNYNNGVRKGVPIDIEHRTDPKFGKQAAGWLTKVYAKAKENGQMALMGSVDWNNMGRELVADKRFRYLSGEFNPPEVPYTDPEGKLGTLKNVLKAVTLTNNPLMKGLAPVTASEEGVMAGESKITAIFAEGEPMQLEQIRTLDADKLTDEQKTFLAEHKAELSEAELTKFSLKAEAPKKVEEPAKVEPKVPVAATEDGTVAIKATDLADLQAKAEMGVKAYEEAQGVKATAFVDGLVKDGVIKAGEKGAVVEFYKGLSEAQKTEFETKVVKNLVPAGSVLANEIGSGEGGGSVAAAEELHTKTQAEMAEKKVDYTTAMKSVLASDNDLAKRVNAERAGN